MNKYTQTHTHKPGPQFNIKMISYQYRKSHCGDKTILRPSYLHNGISYTGKMTSLYWIRAQDYILFDILQICITIPDTNAPFHVSVGNYYNYLNVDWNSVTCFEGTVDVQDPGNTTFMCNGTPLGRALMINYTYGTDNYMGFTELEVYGERGKLQCQSHECYGVLGKSTFSQQLVGLTALKISKRYTSCVFMREICCWLLDSLHKRRTLHFDGFSRGWRWWIRVDFLCKNGNNLCISYSGPV